MRWIQPLWLSLHTPGTLCMRIESIRSHLRPYSIYQKRKTTINHAFASALAPCSDFNRASLSAAMAMLGQSIDADLRCVYCERDAQTWDHLTGLVKESELNGYGHQIGNLVPCCRDCNSRKGSKNWEEFVTQQIPEPRRTPLKIALRAYQDAFAIPIDLAAARNVEGDAWDRYDAIRAEIHSLMQEADTLAATLRYCVRGSTPSADRSGSASPPSG